MFGNFAFKAVSSLLVSILSFAVLASPSSPAPTSELLMVRQQQSKALKEFHDLQIQAGALKIETQFGRITKRGSQGDDVRQLQQYLNTLNPSFSSLYISGFFGAA